MRHLWPKMWHEGLEEIQSHGFPDQGSGTCYTSDRYYIRNCNQVQILELT